MCSPHTQMCHLRCKLTPPIDVNFLLPADYTDTDLRLLPSFQEVRTTQPSPAQPLARPLSRSCTSSSSSNLPSDIDTSPVAMNMHTCLQVCTPEIFSPVRPKLYMPQVTSALLPLLQGGGGVGRGKCFAQQSDNKRCQ
jgi:hypothetical protein